MTCDWWDDVFVNEGVTSYLMSQMLEDMNPHWDVVRLLLQQQSFLLIHDISRQTCMRRSPDAGLML